MTGIHGRETGVILEAYDYSRIEVLADVGGENGSKISAILQSVFTNCQANLDKRRPCSRPMKSSPDS